MADRADIEKLVREAYAARVRDDLDGVCRLFSDDAKFQMAGASHASPVALTSVGANQFRAVMSQMIKTFILTDHTILSMLIDGAKVAVHWRAKVRSTVSGDTVVSEVVDLIEVRDGRIGSFTEFCDTALVAKLLGGQQALTA